MAACLLRRCSRALCAGAGVAFALYPASSCEPSAVTEKVGPYQIKALLGSGNYGEVWLGVHRQTGERVAVKRIRKDDVERKIVEREILAMQRVRECGGHPHLVTILQHEETKGHYNLVLEVAEGGELFDFLAGGGYFNDEREVARLIQELALGLHFLHEKGIVHQDVKPENCMFSDGNIDRTGTLDTAKLHLKLGDFGCAAPVDVSGASGLWMHQNERLHKSSHTTQVSSSNKQSHNDSDGNGLAMPNPGWSLEFGTTAYLPPEVLRKKNRLNGQNRELDKETIGRAGFPSTDMWSLGCLLYILLCNYHPFDPDADADDEQLRHRILEVRALTYHRYRV